MPALQEILYQTKKSFNASNTVVRDGFNRETQVLNNGESVSIIKRRDDEEPGKLSIVITPAGVSFPDENRLPSHYITHKGEDTEIEPLWDLSIAMIHLGREYEKDTFRLDKFTTIINNYPLRKVRRVIKLITGWKGKQSTRYLNWDNWDKE